MCVCGLLKQCLGTTDAVCLAGVLRLPLERSSPATLGKFYIRCNSELGADQHYCRTSNGHTMMMHASSLGECCALHANDMLTDGRLPRTTGCYRSSWGTCTFDDTHRIYSRPLPAAVAHKTAAAALMCTTCPHPADSAREQGEDACSSGASARLILSWYAFCWDSSTSTLALKLNVCQVSS